MRIQDTIALLSGANRGIGLATAEGLLDRGVAKLYACARNPDSLASLVEKAPDRVTTVKLDVTDQAQVNAAAAQAADARLLINNAGVLTPGSVLSNDFELAEFDMSVNYFGLLRMIRAFAPVLEANGGGAITNLLSVVSMANMPVIGGYSASKAAAWSLTQAVRPELAERGVSVFGVYPGPVETDMTDGFEMDKADVREVAREILDGIEADRLDIFPDAFAKQVADTWTSNPRAVEAQFAEMRG